MNGRSRVRFLPNINGTERMHFFTDEEFQIVGDFQRLAKHELDPDLGARLMGHLAELVARRASNAELMDFIRRGLAHPEETAMAEAL